MKKILITGNSGYIGSHLTKMLQDEYEVHGLDINPPQLLPKTHHTIDIRKLFNIEEEYDAVIHLAALVNVGESEQIPIQYYITNLNGTMNVINKIKTKNFIFASTGAAVGCESAYGISKRAAEDVVGEYCTTHRPTPYTIFRFYNVIGSTVVAPTNPDGLMYNLMKARETGEFTIFGKDYDASPDGTCIRDYVHVNEICDALKQAIEKPSNSVESLGHGVGYTVREIVNKFMEVNDCDFDVKYGPRRKGDLAVSVLEDVSPYMRNLYTMEELLKV
jgi:UDP-glucose 4-epimerase